MLRIEGVSKSYKKGAVRAVDNLSLHVRPGEIFGFLGPNGAGKTTTIKMIVGLLNPDAGRIAVAGHDVVTDPIGAKAVIGFVPDNPDLFDKLTGVEYLNFMGDVYGVPTEERR
ncbi:MAG: ABC transporter ATP-binding protein, partial [Firmicutes bacterium]|nr:ABC transporter ATP-binding protein [Bacillota bacterium]